jgi:hypothetical protein
VGRVHDRARSGDDAGDFRREMMRRVILILMVLSFGACAVPDDPGLSQKEDEQEVVNPEP